MFVISAIIPLARRAGRFEILVDGTAVATLSVDAIERLALSVGASIDGVTDRIASESAQLAVYDRALNMLAFRARSSVELARLLVRKGESPEHADGAIARLQAQGLLDDAAFAQSFTRAKVLGARHSRRRVQRDLARKGVPRDVSDAAIDLVFEQEGVDQRSLVEDAARKKLRGMTKLDPAIRRRRLYAFLARRGYDGEDIRKAMDAVAVELTSSVE